MKILQIIETIDRKNLHFKDVTKRVPELTAAAEKLRHGELSKDEYQDIVNKYKPVSAYDELPPSASDDEMYNALHSDKRTKLNSPIEQGTPVKLRLDIPAYKDHGVWVPTIHDNEGTVISHGATAIIKNVKMSVPEKGALNIARGRSDKGKKIDKSPIATMNGYWIPASVDQARKMAQHALSDPDWIQVGMDPERHSYFYNRATQEPVIAADIAIQIGGLVIVKNPTYANKQDFIYELIDQEIVEHLNKNIINELQFCTTGPNGFQCSQCTKDCSGHTAGYQWGRKKKSTSHQNTPSQSFNNGTAFAAHQNKNNINPIAPQYKDKGKFTKYNGPNRYK